MEHMMNLNGILAILALGLSSCVPVRFDTISWRERSESPERQNGILIRPALRSVWTSPLNSKSKGPWRVVIGIRSPKDQEIILESIKVRDSAGMVWQADLHHRVLLALQPNSGEWLGSYHMDEAIVPKTAKGPLTIDLKVKAGGSPSYTITTVYESKHIVGKETVNMLTM
jgi:hypothetical protein